MSCPLCVANEHDNHSDHQTHPSDDGYSGSDNDDTDDEATDRIPPILVRSYRDTDNRPRREFIHPPPHLPHPPTPFHNRFRVSIVTEADHPYYPINRAARQTFVITNPPYVMVRRFTLAQLINIPSAMEITDFQWSNDTFACFSASLAGAPGYELLVPVCYAIVPSNAPPT